MISFLHGDAECALTDPLPNSRFRDKFPERNAFRYESMVIFMKTTRMTTLLLAALMAAGTVTFASCGGDGTASPTQTEAPGTDTAAEEVTTAEPDPFEGFDFGGEEIRILVSANDYDGRGSSIYAIKHEEEENGDIVKDNVYKRNKNVEELLNVQFVFTENEEDYTVIPKTINKYVTAGDDAYDLVIHDLFPLCTLSVQNAFLNTYDLPYLDFSKDYWYDAYMKDVSFASDDKRYILAGDYFLDILRSAHALYVNKEMFNSIFESAEELYDHVLNGTWTHETFLGYINEAYQDINGDGKADDDDRYGYCTINYWGPMIPWVIASDITFLEYESDGAPRFAMNNERSVQLLLNLNDIFHGEGTHNYSAGIDINTAAFVNGNALFGGYQRVSSLEMFRDMETDIGILPYPKMDESQENYITSSHDTANVGVIPMTCSKGDTMGAVLEVLSRESAKDVIPAYYETALKVKYARDEMSAQMLDIIRYNISCVFPVAFGNYCYDMPLQKAFSTPLNSKKTDFVSNYVKYEEKAQAKLDELWEAFNAME